MTTLREARKKGKLDQFIKEHEEEIKGTRSLTAERNRIAPKLRRHPVEGRDPWMTGPAPRSMDPGLRRGDVIEVGRFRDVKVREQAA